jgi:tetratricopeptide (TPR) repeat protein
VLRPRHGTCGGRRRPRHAGRARDLPHDDRAASHRAALEAALRGDWTLAARHLERHSLAFPRDLIALQAGHLIDFLRADARTLRDRIARALPHWDAVPGRSFLLGMYAFGLEEAGDYARAEAAGREAVATEPRDAWAHHAVAHVMEMEGRAAEGLDWITTREAHWAGESNFLKVHNWWHRALCHLELGDAPAALALYDGPIGGSGGGTAVNLVDASALLWRLDLMGADVGDRWDSLSAAWEPFSDGRLYPFNDFHAAMAHLGAGRHDRVDALLDRMAGRGRNRDRRLDRAAGPPADRGADSLPPRRLARGRGPALERPAHRGRLRRQPCPARRHRLDTDRGRPARRHRRHGAGPRG